MNYAIKIGNHTMECIDLHMNQDMGISGLTLK